MNTVKYKLLRYMEGKTIFKHIVARVIVIMVFLGMVLAEATMWNGKNPLVSLGFFILSLSVSAGILHDGLRSKVNVAGMLASLVFGLVFGLMPEGIVLEVGCLSVALVIVLVPIEGGVLEKAFASLFIIGLMIWGVSVERRYHEGKPSQTVVLENVDVKSKNNIYISLEGGSIFKVSSKVVKDWDFQAGDTVKVIIYDDKVISCEGK